MLERHPGAQVILAHAGIGDHEAAVAVAERRPNLTFDVAVWNLLDIRALLARVAPEQILYGTDAPYYGHACSQAKLLLALRAAGCEPARRAVLWDNAERIAERPLAQRRSPAAGPSRAEFGWRAAARARVPAGVGADGVDAAARPAAARCGWPATRWPRDGRRRHRGRS